MSVKPQPVKLWAWWSEINNTYEFIYPSRFLVTICSADGFKRATKAGEGKIVRVTVRTLARKRDKASH